MNSDMLQCSQSMHLNCNYAMEHNIVITAQCRCIEILLVYL